MYKLYKTSCMEDTIRLMEVGGGLSLIFEYFQNYGRIRAQLNKVKDLSIRLGKPWHILDGAHTLPENGLVYYQHHTAMTKNLPKADKVLFIEMPHSLSKLNKFLDRILPEEVIIYEPPDWSMFKDTIDTKYPKNNIYQIVKEGINKFIADEHPYNYGLTYGFTLQGEDCPPPFNACMFTSKELSEEVGLNKKQVERALYLAFRGRYIKYFPYRMVWPPKDPELFSSWDILQKEPGRGSMRCLRSNELGRIFSPGGVHNRVENFKKSLNKLIKTSSVIKYPSIYAFNTDLIDEPIPKSLHSEKLELLNFMISMVKDSPTY